MKLVFDPSTVVVKTLNPKPMLFPSHQWSFHGARWDLRESTGVILGRFKYSGFKRSGFSFTLFYTLDFMYNFIRVKGSGHMKVLKFMILQLLI